MNMQTIGAQAYYELDPTKKEELERQCVKIAAEMLDSEAPGWENKIDPETLEMDDCCNCVLGQVFGLDIEDKLSEIMSPFDKANKRRSMGTSNSGFAKGLSKPRISACYQETYAFSSNARLKCLWIEEIVERKYPDGKDQSLA